jgi:hypothetical protein
VVRPHQVGVITPDRKLLKHRTTSADVDRRQLGQRRAVGAFMHGAGWMGPHNHLRN